MSTTRDMLWKQISDYDVKFVKLWFTDILGFLKSFSIPVEEMEKALDEGIGFDGSSIKGFCRIDESDMVAVPDPSTFTILPWRPRERSVARMFCDILNPDGTPYAGDPRQVLPHALDLRRNCREGHRIAVHHECRDKRYDNDGRCCQYLLEHSCLVLKMEVFVS